MIPIFIQTNRHLIDLAKLTHADLVRKDRRVKFSFVGGGSVLLSEDEADRVLKAMGEMARGGKSPLVACAVGGGK